MSALGWAFYGVTLAYQCDYLFVPSWARHWATQQLVAAMAKRGDR